MKAHGGSETVESARRGFSMRNQGVVRRGGWLRGELDNETFPGWR